MAKFLKVANQQNCIGCELCIAECQRQLKKVGLEGALIRVFKESFPGAKRPHYTLQLDPKVQHLATAKIAGICPTNVFSIEDEEETNGLIS
jgi:Fe-S-cluster-containing dehydrogenase component